MAKDRFKFEGSNVQHRLFRSDTKLTPAEINQLLGIRVSVPSETLANNIHAERVSNASRVFAIAVLTLILTSATLIGSMYQLKVGPFYDSNFLSNLMP